MIVNWIREMGNGRGNNLILVTCTEGGRITDNEIVTIIILFRHQPSNELWRRWFGLLLDVKAGPVENSVWSRWALDAMNKTTSRANSGNCGPRDKVWFSWRPYQYFWAAALVVDRLACRVVDLYGFVHFVYYSCVSFHLSVDLHVACHPRNQLTGTAAFGCLFVPCFKTLKIALASSPPSPLFFLCLCLHRLVSGLCFYCWITSRCLENYIYLSMDTWGPFWTLVFLLFWLSVDVISSDNSDLNLPDGPQVTYTRRGKKREEKFKREKHWAVPSVILANVRTVNRWAASQH